MVQLNIKTCEMYNLCLGGYSLVFQRNEVSSSSVLDPEDEDTMILQNVMKYLTTQCHIPEDLTLDTKNYPAANTIHCSIEKKLVSRTSMKFLYLALYCVTVIL